MNSTMIKLIDIHAHINLMVKKKGDAYLTAHELNNAHEIIEKAIASGVYAMINVGTSLIESKNSIALAKKYSSVYAAIGIHPNDCSVEWHEDVKELAALIKHENKVIAIGEIGLDKHYPGYDIQRQIDAFRVQIELALKHNFPILVHSRDATQETLRVIDEYVVNNVRGIIHCFSDTIDIAHEYNNRSFLLGIGGTVTYPKNQYLRDVILGVGLEHIVLETDAPYLTPQAFRGSQNHPYHLRTIAEYIASLKSMPIADVAEKTTANVHALLPVIQ